MSVEPVTNANSSECQADLTYAMTVNLIKIQDTGEGTKSVADDLGAVLDKIEAWRQGSVASFCTMYRDSEGYWNGVKWDGEHAKCFAIRETCEAAGRRSSR